MFASCMIHDETPLKREESSDMLVNIEEDRREQKIKVLSILGVTIHTESSANLEQIKMINYCRSVHSHE